MNRQALDVVFRQAVRDLQRREASLSAILLDVDNFKDVNDRLGHLVGDRVIAAIARRLRESVRESDVIGRWGGEEFLVLLKNCDLEQAMAVAEKIRTAMASRDFVGEGVTWPVTVSLGVAQFNSGETEDSLVGRADKALYQAKAEGRNRIVAAPS
jgi:diguanylate cyclase (GGDEF)-like protein